MDSGLAWPVSSEVSSGLKLLPSSWMTVVTTRICDFAVQGGNGCNTLHLLCQCISTNWNYFVPDTGFWTVNWTQLEISRNVITPRTMASILDKCSVQILLSTVNPPNLVILSHPFCPSRFVSPWWLLVCRSLYSMYCSVVVKSLSWQFFKSSHS